GSGRALQACDLAPWTDRCSFRACANRSSPTGLPPKSMSMTTGNGFGGRNGLDELAEALQRAHAGVVSLVEQERKLQELEAKLVAERTAIDARDEAIAALERV